MLEATGPALQSCFDSFDDGFCCDAEVFVEVIRWGAGAEAVHSYEAVFVAEPAVPALGDACFACDAQAAVA